MELEFKPGKAKATIEKGLAKISLEVEVNDYLAAKLAMLINQPDIELCSKSAQSELPMDDFGGLWR